MKYTIIILLMALSVSSCSIIKKTFRKAKASKSEQVQSKSDSTGSTRIDSSHVIKSDSTGVTKIEDKRDNWWKIDIDTTEPSTVEISRDSAGNQVVKATGKIKSVSGKSSQKVNRTDSVHKVNSDSSKASINQTASVTKSEKKSSHEAIKQSEKNVDKTKVLPGLGWALVIAAIAGTVYMAYRFLKK
jgi:hypothetical protein